MRRLFGFYCVLMAVSGDCKTGKSFACADKNAAAMAVAHFFPYTLFVSVIVLAAGYMAYTSIITDVLLLLMGFALLAYVCSFFFYKVFAKYIDEEPVGEDDPLYGSRE